MKSQNMKMCILSALFAAFTAILSQIAFPVPFITGNIPFSLGLLAVLITSGVLGGVWGTASIAVYIALGCVGVPVFANFRAAEALVGATGGYIVGYLFCALVVGFVTDRRKGASYAANVLAMVAGHCGVLCLWNHLVFDLCRYPVCRGAFRSGCTVYTA